MFFQLLDKINELDPLAKRGRKRKLSNERALSWSLYVLFEGVSWASCLEKSVDTSTIRRRFAKWAKAGIFTDIRKHMLADHFRDNPSDYKNLVIDATFVKNVSGRDGTGKNPTDRGRQATKVSVISTDSGSPVGVTYAPGNVADLGIAVAIPTSRLVEETLDDIPGCFFSDKRRRYCLIGDKGYLLKSEVLSQLRQKYRTRIIRPRKTNDRRYRVSHNDCKKLRKRICIEQLFGRIDKFKRVKERHDHSLLVFTALHDLAILLVFMERVSKRKMSSVRTFVRQQLLGVK